MLVRPARHHLFIQDDELGRAGDGPADYRHNAAHLPPGYEAKGATLRAGEDGPVRIFLVAHFAGVLQNKNASGLHLLGKPFRHDVQLRHHGHLRQSSPYKTGVFAAEAQELRRLPGPRVDCFCAGRRLKISARTSRTASLRQTPSSGWREFLSTSITW